MLYRLFKVEFDKFKEINLELFTEIDNFLSKRENGSYGEMLFPKKAHFDDNVKNIFGVNNKILVALYANDDQAASIFASDFVNYMDEIDSECLLKYHPVPLIYISFIGPKYIDANVIKEISNNTRIKEHIWFPEYHFNSFSFRLRCQIHMFDVLVSEILNVFDEKGYDYFVEYYF